jgi:hypothetical protein
LAGARQGRALLAGALVIGGAVLVYVFGVADRERFIYAKSIEQIAGEAAAPERRYRLQGVIEAGSLVVSGRCLRTFRVRSPTSERRVTIVDESCRDAELVCDLPGLELLVSVEGRVVRRAPDFVFQASEILLSCPPRHEATAAGRIEACEKAPPELRRRCGLCSHATSARLAVPEQL